MEKQNKDILIVAGEASGDIHAAHLVRAMYPLAPSLRFFGLGGKKMEQEKVRLMFNIAELAVVGIWEAVKKYGTFKRIFNDLLDEVDRVKPAAAILVDYPGFNLRLAGELKKRNIPVIYYISPQIWAWGQNRIKYIRETVSLMVVLFKFEEELYKKNNVPVFFAGHPLLDNIKVNLSRGEFCGQTGLETGKTTLALLPGSRDKEVQSLLPVMLKSAGIISKELNGNIQFIILRSSNVREEIFNTILGTAGIPVKMSADTTYEGLAASDFALVASGTATLETALLKIPMAILYKTSFLTWAFGKMALKIPYIGLVNVVKGEKFIEEFIQNNADPEKISAHVLKTLRTPGKISAIQSGYAHLAASLGEKGATQRAAQTIAEFLRKI
ncbi:MAG: lipid-A-disaccharide synthase [Candidatus Omnitrophica bacterium]|nr:lipid-A-disaccharide synthase [Candidatus Omnitrophota bacterium]